MKTTLVVREKGVPKNSALAKSEQELYEAMTGAFEAFYSQGVILRRIMVDMEFKNAGFDSFAAYMNERQPCGLKKTQAYRLIKAMEVRVNLPVFPQIGESGTWTEGAIRPLLHKRFSPLDQRRIGKKVAAAVKAGAKLTAALVKSICDDERGVERKKAEAKAAEVEATPTAAGQIGKLFGVLALWKQSLGNVPSEFWSDAISEDATCLNGVSRLLSELSSIIADASAKKRK